MILAKCLLTKKVIMNCFFDFVISESGFPGGNFGHELDVLTRIVCLFAPIVSAFHIAGSVMITFEFGVNGVLGMIFSKVNLVINHDATMIWNVAEDLKAIVTKLQTGMVPSRIPSRASIMTRVHRACDKLGEVPWHIGERPFITLIKRHDLLFTLLRTSVQVRNVHVDGAVRVDRTGRVVYGFFFVFVVDVFDGDVPARANLRKIEI